MITATTEPCRPPQRAHTTPPLLRTDHASSVESSSPLEPHSRREHQQGQMSQYRYPCPEQTITKHETNTATMLILTMLMVSRGRAYTVEYFARGALKGVPRRSEPFTVLSCTGQSSPSQAHYCPKTKSIRHLPSSFLVFGPSSCITMFNADL